MIQLNHQHEFSPGMSDAQIRQLNEQQLCRALLQFRTQLAESDDWDAKQVLHTLIGKLDVALNNPELSRLIVQQVLNVSTQTTDATPGKKRRQSKR